MRVMQSVVLCLQLAMWWNNRSIIFPLFVYDALLNMFVVLYLVGK